MFKYLDGGFKPYAVKEGFQAHNLESESIIFKDELPMYVLEYAKDQLYIAGANTHMYLVKDW